MLTYDAEILTRERGQSAPARFDQSGNSFGIDNTFFFKQFTHGNIEERMDPQYWEFFRQQQMKKCQESA